MRSSLILSTLLLCAPAFAQNLSTLDKVLVPVLNMRSIAGANGSTFSTSFGLLSPGPVVYYPAPGDAPHVGANQPQILALPLWEAPVVAKGRFVFVDRPAAAAPMFAEVASRAADGSVAGTALPIVREHDVQTGKTIFGLLPNRAVYGPIPSYSNWPAFVGYSQRHTLRVYDWDSTGKLEVFVRLRYATWLSRGVIIEKRVAVNARDYNDPSYPFYAEVDPARLLHDGWCYPSLHMGCDSFDAILEVEPVTPGARYYAFVSTTDNATGHVAIYTAR